MHGARGGVPRQVAGGINLDNLMADGVAGDVEPPPAAGGVAPALQVQSLGIVTMIKILAPGAVVGRRRIGGPLFMRLAALLKLALIARAAPGTGDQQHWAGS